VVEVVDVAVALPVNFGDAPGRFGAGFAVGGLGDSVSHEALVPLERVGHDLNASRGAAALELVAQRHRALVAGGGTAPKPGKKKLRVKGDSKGKEQGVRGVGGCRWQEETELPSGAWRASASTARRRKVEHAERHTDNGSTQLNY